MSVYECAVIYSNVQRIQVLELLNTPDTMRLIMRFGSSVFVCFMVLWNMWQITNLGQSNKQGQMEGRRPFHSILYFSVGDFQSVHH